MNTLRPYFVRAVYEWCMDSGYTPYLMVLVDEQTMVPMDFVQNGEIVLNLGGKAVGNLQMLNDHIAFSARFSGVPHNLYIPMHAVSGIYAKETGQGMFFEAGPPDHPLETKPSEASSQVEKIFSAKTKKNHLKLIK